jgi:hypothetical protein
MNKFTLIAVALFHWVFSNFVYADQTVTLNAPIGSLQFAAIHEAGHVVAAKIMGLTVIKAHVFEKSNGGTIKHWKGITHLRAAKNGKSLAVVKLAGNFAEFFIDNHNRVHVPSFLDVIGNRNTISQSDAITQLDLGADSLLEAQQKTFHMLRTNVRLLESIYERLRTKHVYP